jgi:hypothetical protein
MEIEQKQINKKRQEGFDEETKLKIQAYLDEIDRKQQQQRYHTTRQNISFIYRRNME